MHNLFLHNVFITQSNQLTTNILCQFSCRIFTHILLLTLLCSFNIGQSAIVPLNQQQQEIDNGKILQVGPLVNYYSESDDNLEENFMQKRNYQYIWRNVQMRMPVYSTNDMSRINGAKRSPIQQNQVLRHRANTLYRLG